MTEEIREIFEDIRQAHATQGDMYESYRQLDRLLVRTVKTQTAGFKMEFTNFATRLHRLCQSVGHNAYPLEIFRSHWFSLRQGTLTPDATDYAYDLKAVCEGIAAFYHTNVPDDLRNQYPQQWRSHAQAEKNSSWSKRIRITVRHWDEQFVYGRDNEHPAEHLLKVCYAENSQAPFAALYTQLYEGAQLNLLSVRIQTEQQENGKEETTVLYPSLLIIDPDFLIDITSICSCIQPYGCSAYTYLLNKFTPPARSAAIQLGNAANQFLDDCIYEHGMDQEEDEEKHYLHSLRKSFRHSPLTYSTLPDINRNFFDACRTQYGNIRKTVKESFDAAEIDIRKTNVQLEPSFLCEALGIQGRMDLLASDGSKLVELKSGKATEFPSFRPKDEHRIQMALYKEILYYNMDRSREHIQSYLFYSRYPKFYAIDVSPKEIERIMALRNAICHIEKRLRDGDSRQLIEELTEERINVLQCKDRFYMTYLRPRIIRITHPLHNMGDTEAAYFHHFLTFMEREQFLAKVGDGRPDSCNGFAETWCSDTATKLQNGNILTGLKLTPLTDEDEDGAIMRIHADMPEYTEDFLPNFRLGDMVMLYERNDERDIITRQQFFRGIIEEIHPRHLILRLSYKQRNAEVFHTESSYAIEPGYMEASFSQAYSGLFSLLTAPKERKALILGERQATTNPSVQLGRHYLNEEIDRIVLHAKQAEDYFLLVGPPGTGKTSVALKAMVEEFLGDTPRKTLLLMAYTNRAVDEICAMLSTIMPQPEYIRIGQELNCDPAYRNRLMKNVIKDAENRRQIYETLSPVNIFTGTISSICGQMELFNLKPIDIAIIDEASQVLEPQLLPLLCATTTAHTGDYNLRRCAIGKFILIGDHKQLPAVVMQPSDSSRVNDIHLNAIGLTDCRNSLFERLHALQKQHGTKGIVEMLHRQGRMHPALSEFVNRKFYDNRLDIVPLPHQLETLGWKTYPEDEWHTFIAQTRLGFFSVQPDATAQENDKSNRKEADIAGRLVKSLKLMYEMQGTEPELPKRIGIIVPFRAQIAMIRSSLIAHGITDAADITIDTVERYQGSQRDIIIFSTTVSRYYQLSILSEPVCTEGHAIDRKLNVALTRARKQFFLIGNRELLTHCPSYEELISFIPEKNIFLP